MKRIFTIYSISFLTALILGVFLITGCNEEPTPSLADMIGPSAPNPKITSVEPAGEALAGVTDITINGSNFLADTSVGEATSVFFGNNPAEILQLTDTKIVVKAPNVLGDSLLIKVSADGDNFSNKIKYSLKPAVSIFYTEFQSFEKPHAITIDKNGNVYVSLEGRGVKKITPNAELSDFAPSGVETFWNDLQYGPSNIIYGAKQNRGVWQIIENTRPTNAPWAITPTGTKISALDFDANKNIWAGGANQILFRITPAGDIKNFPFNANVSAVRVFNGSLYVGGLKDGTQGVWVFQIISSDSLGAPSLYYDFSSNYPNSPVNAITFSTDGDLYIGSTRLENPVIIVHPDKSSEILYPGLIKNSLVKEAGLSDGDNADVESFVWGPGNFLYFTQRGLTIYKLNMQKQGAPYYGRE